MDELAGPLIEPFYKQVGDALIGMTTISRNEHAELYHSTMFGTKENPKYVLATSENLLIEFGIAGMVKSITKKSDRGYEKILNRDGQGNYTINETLIKPFENTTIKTNQKNNDSLEKLINYAYERVGALPDDEWSTIQKKFKNYDANRVIARFKDFRKLVGYNGIIPDFDEHQVPVVTTMTGCPKKCVYCCIGGKVEVYSSEKIMDNIQLAKEVLKTYHKPIIPELYEGFINASDILWHNILKSELDPLEIVALYKEAFPNVQNLGTFFGVENILKVGPEYLKSLMYNLGAKNKKDKGFGKGITKGYVGIETGHSQGSKLLGKKHSFKNKVDAINILKQANIGVKEIIQVGVFGKGFYEKEEDIGKPNKFISSREAMDATIKFVLETAPYRVMLSEFTILEDLPIEKLIKKGQIVPYDNNDEVKNEIDYFVEKVKKVHRKREVKWQGQDWKHPDYEPPIELDYQE